MTDKHIIIDGVDVSGCKKYEHEIVRCNATLKNMCFCGGRCTDKKNANCYYKQLKRKAENEKYSLFIEKLCDYAGLECDDEEQAMRTLLDLASQMNKARWIIDRYKQTLTEIEEIAMCIMDDDLEESSAYYNAKQILQKINECEVENEYNTKDIRHINEKNKEYIAENNRMTKK